MSEEIITQKKITSNHPHFNRSRAKADGKTRYYSPKPCPKGHIGERMTSTGMCVICLKKHKLKPENVKRELIRLKEDRKNNPEKYRQKEERARENPHHKITASVRIRLNNVLKDKYRSKNFEKIFGYTREELISHIEKQFLSGMSWDNFGEWHIDHIVPIKLLPYETVGDDNFKFCWAMSNLRPLWASENYKKSSIRTHLL